MLKKAPIEPSIADDQSAITQRLQTVGREIGDFCRESLVILESLTDAKFKALSPLLKLIPLSLRELELIDATTTSALKGHIKRMGIPAVVEDTQSTALAIVSPITVLQMQEAVTKKMVGFFKRSEFEAFEAMVFDQIDDSENLRSILSLDANKIFIIWEILPDLRNDQIDALSNLDEVTIVENVDSLISMQPLAILKLKKMSLSQKVGKKVAQVRAAVSSTLESSGIERLSKQAWDTLRNSFKLRISKHTFEGILHHVHNGVSVDKVTDESPSFYKAFRNMVDNGKLAPILTYLKKKLHKNFVARSRVLGSKLISQLLSVVGGKKLVPKEALATV